MKKKIIGILILPAVLFLFLTSFWSCVSKSDYLLLDRYANDPIMKGIQDNDQDLAQIEDGSGAIGEASSCPT